MHEVVVVGASRTPIGDIPGEIQELIGDVVMSEINFVEKCLEEICQDLEVKVIFDVDTYYSLN
ncbi:hypothetical protein [Sporomusa sp.]|uniref:hypothetical protein n=1 Tax=Sporomusa sp. TaxID=2078658 RepID=UPI002CA25C7E|nr:hypothetical protein [Sporomusa sp.]HWR42950.1 hypothetical protein [Sporomusa sp.]